MLAESESGENLFQMAGTGILPYTQALTSCCQLVCRESWAIFPQMDLTFRIFVKLLRKTNTDGFSPLQVRNGHIKRITDNDIQSLVLEIEGTNVRWVTSSIIYTFYVRRPVHLGINRLLSQAVWVPSTTYSFSQAPYLISCSSFLICTIGVIS